ncbi:hypothetical protein PFTANZ_01580 [Plasmodium falciparum Tanzania (2000708)]|uniref:N-acetylglucosaminylphosphatidylinositol deacetylase n=1 Tax=Plasmodium falciparum Tanzania (2000708) TaxID=1036725 RepID=A0A024W9Z1_PLAFA|nr:hypothetical protein PFTANZ_01580 [Plasmodium falciparum Tanzania (2000708)]
MSKVIYVETMYMLMNKSLIFIDRNNEEIIINIPVTYVLSNLLSSLKKTVTYNTDDLNNSCNVLIKMLHLDLLKILYNLQYHHGIFNGITEKYLIEFRNIFVKRQKTNTEDNNDMIWEECFVLKKSIDKIMNINSFLLTKSRNRYMDYLQNRRKRYRDILFMITYNVSDINLNTYIKSIYNYIHISTKIIEDIQYIYNQEVYATFFVRTELIETYFLRNPKQLKNTCSIYIMITISWFFNQINIGMYNKNKNVYDLFKEKFSKSNVKQIINSIYTNNVENKTNILQICNDSMTNTIELIKKVIKNYYKQNNVLSNYNINFAGLIKFIDIQILRMKFIQSTLEKQPLIEYDTLNDDHLNNDSIIKRENMVCMMKYISNKINTYISLLKKSDLQTIMLQNYDKYNIYLDTYFTHNENVFFCSSPGQYLIIKIFFYSFFNIINIYEFFFFFFFLKKKKNIFLLCLSNGNYYGYGNIREQELYKVWSYIGGEKNNCHIWNDNKIQDGWLYWDEKYIFKLIKDYCIQYDIKTIFTFDNYGVSGHPNHISAYKSIR